MQTDFKSLDKISPLVASQVPEFVRIDHPTFIAFLNAYYEWLETQGAKLRNLMDLAKVRDVDTTFDEYITHFKQQYLLDFPENLAINQSTGIPVEEKTLIKYIKQFYQAKGTEKTYEFLFRILYDTNVEFYYPKLDILKASDGKWIQKKSIKIAGSQGNIIFQASGRRLYQKNASGSVTAAASILEVSKYNVGPFSVYELILSNINGTINSNFPLEIEINNSKIIEPTTYSVVNQINITNRGSNYRVGNTVIFTNVANDIGQGARAKVTQVDPTGKILKIEFEDFGINYKTAPTISISSDTGNGFTGTCTVGAVCNFSGYYANNDGRLNTNKVLQDNHYYQNYSYVLKTEVVINRYRDVIKRLIHPAGLGFFGQISIKRCAQSNLDIETALIRYEIPLIGHYLPYTNKTYDDLSAWFVFGGTAQGYSPPVHDMILTTQPNPKTNGVDFVIAQKPYKNSGFPAADPWWIIYKHPNRRIGDPVIARIEYDLKGLFGTGSSEQGKKDFLNGSTGSDSWPEWNYKNLNQRLEWAKSFTGGFKYAILKYDTTSEFRKITMGSFFNMPIGDEFSCAREWENQITHAASPNGLIQDTICYIPDSTTGGLSSAPINVSPIARILFASGNSKIDTDGNGIENFTVSATASSDSPPGSVVSYSWSNGATGATTSITGSVTGNLSTNIVTLTVTDNLGATGTTFAFYYVTALTSNIPPVAVITPSPSNVQTDYDGDGFEKFFLSGQNSYDLDGTVVGYLWSNGLTAREISFDAPVGTTSVCLTVYDNLGASGATCMSLLVFPKPEPPGPTGPTGPTGPPTGPDIIDICLCDDSIVSPITFDNGFLRNGGNGGETGNSSTTPSPVDPDGPSGSTCDCTTVVWPTSTD